jgi:protein SCO1/2
MSNKKNSKKYLLGLAVAIVLPLSVYFIADGLIARGVMKGKIKLPDYYIIDTVKQVVVEGKTVQDTFYHKVGNLQLTNQLGDKIAINEDLKGKILLVNFFFVNCPTVCPKLTANMKMIQNAFKKNDTSVHLLSITVNPEKDTFQALRAYADRYKVNHDYWWFLTGDKSGIYNFARNELYVVTGGGDGGADDFMHSEKLVLIDKDRHIRGYYNGLDTVDLRRCADDIVLLTMEKKKRKH